MTPGTDGTHHSEAAEAKTVLQMLLQALLGIFILVFPCSRAKAGAAHSLACKNAPSLFILVDILT